MGEMKHGTVQRYRKELREKALGGPGPCTECKKAQAEYMSGYRLLHGRKRQTETETTKVRRKALNRLAAEHPERFEELMAEEVALSALL